MRGGAQREGGKKGYFWSGAIGEKKTRQKGTKGKIRTLACVYKCESTKEGQVRAYSESDRGEGGWY